MACFIYSLLPACLWLLHSVPLLATDAGITCPESCVCVPHQKLGGTSVQCSKQGLDQVPTHYPADTSEILLQHNNINVIPPAIFSKLEQLSRLDLAHNKIDNISFEAFPPQLKHLNISHNNLLSLEFSPSKLLRLLDLSYNKIMDIPGRTFSKFPVLTTLLLNGNFISRLSREAFGSAGGENDYKTLRKLSLTENKIVIIDDGAFSSLKSLQALSIASNMLTSLNNYTFQGLDMVEFLDASFNRITVVDNGTFQNMKNIQYLYLKGNNLNHVPQGIPMAEWLDISDNLITKINESEKDSLYTSEFFNLANNPLHCDCKLLWLKELWDRREHKVKHFDIPSNFIPKCATPAVLKGEMWDEIGDDMFKCENDTESTVSQVEELDLDDFKHEIGKLVDKQRTLDIHPVLVNLTSETMNLSWELLEGFIFQPESLEVHYHRFGDIDTLKSIILTMESNYITISDLTADTGYVVCIDLVRQSKDLSTPLSQCIEVVTPPLPYVFTVNISLLVTVNSLILKILGSIIFTISFIGFTAVVIGAITAQSKPWSSDLSEHDVVQCDKRQEGDEQKSGSDLEMPNEKDCTQTKSLKTD